MGPSNVADGGATQLCIFDTTRDVPTQTEVRRQLGPKLADVFFESLSSEAKIWLGLTPPLIGPGQVWVDPCSRLNEKPRVTPVPDPHSAILKAFTHKTLLDVGQKHVVLLENKCRQEIEEALRLHYLKLEKDCQRKVSEAVEMTRNEGEEHCKQVVGTLMEHFDKCFKEVVESTKSRMRKECELRVHDERAQVAGFMLEQLQEEVERRELQLCEDFHETLQGELQALTGRHLEQIEKERKIAVEILRETVAKYEQILSDLKFEMETNALVDISRAVVQERCRNQQQLFRMQNECSARIQELKKMIETLELKNEILQRKSDPNVKKEKEEKGLLQDFAKEFQKFINYALKEMPAHAEYLLSVESLMKNLFQSDVPQTPENSSNERVKIDEERVERLEDEKEPKELDRVTETKEKKKCGCTFNYYRFKYSMMKEFSKNFQKPEQPLEAVFKKSPKKPCWKRKNFKVKSDVSLDKSNELYKTLRLVGEEDKDHLLPADDFLRSRMDKLLDICQKNPKVAVRMLGSSR